MCKHNLTNTKGRVGLCWPLLLISPTQTSSDSLKKALLTVFHCNGFMLVLQKIGLCIHVFECACNMTGFLQVKNLGGGGDNIRLFSETVRYCFYYSFYCFLKILGRQNFLGKESFWGMLPCSRKPVYNGQDLSHNQSPYMFGQTLQVTTKSKIPYLWFSFL